MNDGTLIARSCVILIPAPSDWKIYNAFREVANRWREHVHVEGLWLEQSVPILPNFGAPRIPSLFAKLFSSTRHIVGRIELVLGGVRVTYVRSGGYPPFPESFFDEIRMMIDGASNFSEEELQHIIAVLFRTLHPSAITATPPFARIFDVPPATMTCVTMTWSHLPSGDARVPQ